VVVAHGSSTLPACAVVSLRSRTPFVYRQISDSLYWARSAGRRWRVRAALRRAVRTVALWSGARDVLVRDFGVPRARVSVIPNGVPSERFTGLDAAARMAGRRRFSLDPDRPTALYLGALVPEKGVDTVIDALAYAPTVQLLVAGDGPEAARLQEHAGRVAPGRVRFAGSVADPLDCFGAADVVVLASRGGDSMPAVLIEAGMLELPCVATPIGGIPEIVLDGSTGRIVRGASPAELARAIEASAGAAGRAMGAAAREHCLGRFSMDVVSAQWAEVLNDLRSA
jgi:glycosyltransferase involved in cell wall biosynthesis